VTVTGREGHSSQPDRAVNALEIAAELVVFLRRLAERLRRQGGGEGFEPAWTTIHTGALRGGVALNVVPGRAEVDFEIRHLPQHDPDRLVAEIRAFAETTLLPAMRAVDPATGFSWETLIRYPGLAADPDSAIARLVADLAPGPAGRVSFGTEAGLFQAAGIPAMVIGPGDIAQAHRPDEYVTKAQLARCENFLDQLADRLCR
jgi:acetylornithine deacetylase